MNRRARRLARIVEFRRKGPRARRQVPVAAVPEAVPMMNRQATLTDFRALGREHGTEFACRAMEHLQAGGTSDEWFAGMLHRVAAMGDELRNVGSTEREVKAWERALLRTYAETMNAGAAVLRAVGELALAAAPAHGSA